MQLNGAPSHVSLFSYDRHSDNERTWRPDLVPTILAWIANVPADCKVQAFQVTGRGGFAATFEHRGAEVAVYFDDTDGMILTGPCGVMLVEGILAPCDGLLDRATCEAAEDYPRQGLRVTPTAC